MRTEEIPTSAQTSSRTNSAVQSLPKHLSVCSRSTLREYTRWIMRYGISYAANIFFLKEYAHKVYFQGLLDTGISFERIPRIEEMNEILGTDRSGRGGSRRIYSAGRVHGISSLQSYSDPCDMRQIHHIEYTPAPDIVHEAAGHAPDYCRRRLPRIICSVSAKSARKQIDARRGFDLYQAIRHLWIFEKRCQTPIQKRMRKRLREVEQQQMKRASLLKWRCVFHFLYWWTVEYGLMGTLATKQKIYGASSSLFYRQIAG